MKTATTVSNEKSESVTRRPELLHKTLKLFCLWRPTGHLLARVSDDPVTVILNKRTAYGFDL